jgi:hypothetical protein
MKYETLTVQKLKVVGKKPQNYSEDKNGWKTMPLFSLKKGGNYTIRQLEDGKSILCKDYGIFNDFSYIYMYKELTEQLQKGGTILVDEDILSL